MFADITLVDLILQSRHRCILVYVKSNEYDYNNNSLTKHWNKQNKAKV